MLKALSGVGIQMLMVMGIEFIYSYRGYKKSLFMGGIIKVTINDIGIEVSSKDSMEQYKWKYIKRISEYKNMVFFSLQRGKKIAIPKRAINLSVDELRNNLTIHP